MTVKHESSPAFRVEKKEESVGRAEKKVKEVIRQKKSLENRWTKELDEESADFPKK